METLGLRLRSNGGDPSPSLFQQIHHQESRFDRVVFNRAVRIPRKVRRIGMQACSVVSANVGKDSDRKGESGSWLLDSYGDTRFGGDAMICSSSGNHRHREGTAVSADMLHYWITNSIKEVLNQFI
ncbi:hypothetical protein Sjap_023546 [Stephania japonica]|uniref:Uncharacterized protein n=1 Tax=Stephania japonica TaxID=461633 RepID=A0AAP0EKA0_9MAGN